MIAPLYAADKGVNHLHKIPFQDRTMPKNKKHLAFAIPKSVRSHKYMCVCARVTTYAIFKGVTLKDTFIKK